MGAFAEFERALIQERHMAGIALAKKWGAYRDRKKVLTQDKILELKKRIKNKEKKTKIAEALGISRETLYTYLRKEAMAIHE